MNIIRKGDLLRDVAIGSQVCTEQSNPRVFVGWLLIDRTSGLTDTVHNPSGMLIESVSTFSTSPLLHSLYSICGITDLTQRQWLSLTDHPPARPQRTGTLAWAREIFYEARSFPNRNSELKIRT